MSTPIDVFGTLFRDYRSRLNVRDSAKPAILLAALQAATGMSSDEAMIFALQHHRHVFDGADPWLKPVPMGGGA